MAKLGQIHSLGWTGSTPPIPSFPSDSVRPTVQASAGEMDAQSGDTQSSNDFQGLLMGPVCYTKPPFCTYHAKLWPPAGPAEPLGPWPLWEAVGWCSRAAGCAGSWLPAMSSTGMGTAGHTRLLTALAVCLVFLFLFLLLLGLILFFPF